MEIDRAALTDRLIAEAIASDLRDPLAFLQARRSCDVSRRRAWVRERGQIHATELAATQVDIERALDDAFRRLTALAQPSDNISDRVLQPRGVENWATIDLLYRSSAGLLEFDGKGLILRVDREDPGREIHRWRFLSLLLPAGIISAAAAARFGRPGPPSAVRLLHASMAPDGPVVQQHLHQTANISFDQLWASIRLRTLRAPGEFERSLQGERAYCPGLHGGECRSGHSRPERNSLKEKVAHAQHMAMWASTLQMAFATRTVLAEHPQHGGELAQCLICKPSMDAMRWIISPNTRAPPSFRSSKSEAFATARKQRLGRSRCESSSPERLEETLQEEAEAEARLITSAFRYSQKTSNAEDVDYSGLFLQYLRVKTATFGLLVQPPGRSGLSNFLQHFTQISVYLPRGGSSELPAQREFGLNVHSTEFRISPDEWLLREGRVSASKSLIRRRSPTPEEVGSARGDCWLVHFQRRGPNARLPLHGANVRAMEGQARHIGNALQQDRRRLRRLRGVDICGVEDRQPLWVSAETLRSIRERSSLIASKRPDNVEPLRMTLHAGEGFKWLTSGLRAIAEPFEWDLIRRGDRIGHGLALTLEPEGWWRRRKGLVVTSTQLDRLLDLAFLASYSRSCADVPGEVQERRRLFEDPLSTRRKPAQERWLTDALTMVSDTLGLDSGGDPIAVAVAVWRTMGGARMRRLMRRSWAPDRAPSHEQWLYRYLWSRRTQREALEEIRLQVTLPEGEELSLTTLAREKLIRQVARWQIPIESNPSSNLVVGSLDALASQDFLAQSSHHPRRSGHETPPWTISTDDPITFATSLSDEYAYAWAGMVLRAENPYDPAHARSLLEEAAATSMRTRFAARDE